MVYCQNCYSYLARATEGGWSGPNVYVLYKAIGESTEPIIFICLHVHKPFFGLNAVSSLIL